MWELISEGSQLTDSQPIRSILSPILPDKFPHLQAITSDYGLEERRNTLQYGAKVP